MDESLAIIAEPWNTNTEMWVRDIATILINYLI